ncbi:MAG: hypothetical protein OXF94_01695 [Gammaproteobacteria bacterium]|nr:hypothetical protein [Gammaproteobacteria bacterium]
MPETREMVPIGDIDFDTENPRIKMALEKWGDHVNSKRIHFALKSASNGTTSSYSSLKDSIRASGGIWFPITLIRSDARYICIDGNTRLAIYQEFEREGVSGNWSHISSVIVEAATQSDIEMRRVSAHLVGAREWPAYEKARYLHYLRNEELWDYGRMIELCGGNRTEIERQIDAYHDMNEYYRDIVEDTAFQIDRFSGFVELQKPNIKKAIYDAELDLKDFGEWIRDAKIRRLEDTRKLPRVLADDEARNIFLSGGPRSIEEAIRRLDQRRADQRNMDQLLLKDASLIELAEALAERINSLPYSELRILRNKERSESREQMGTLEDLSAQLSGLLNYVAE